MTTMIEQIGGEAGLRALVKEFYDVVERDPKGVQIHALHLRGFGMDHVREEQFNFLSGFLGGRRYYIEKHRHMDVKQIHEHVPIRPMDAKNWLACMDIALANLDQKGAHIEQLRISFRRVAMVLVNRSDD